MSVQLLTEIVLDLEKRVRRLENSNQGREDGGPIRFLLLKFLEQHAHSKDEFEDMSDFELAQRMIELNANMISETTELKETSRILAHLVKDIVTEINPATIPISYPRARAIDKLINDHEDLLEGILEQERHED